MKDKSNQQYFVFRHVLNNIGDTIHAIHLYYWVRLYFGF
jgi:hypothetical protein